VTARREVELLGVDGGVNVTKKSSHTLDTKLASMLSGLVSSDACSEPLMANF
jgi:hypothetical protein